MDLLGGQDGNKPRVRARGGWYFMPMRNMFIDSDLGAIPLEDAHDALADRTNSRTDASDDALANTHWCGAYLGHGSAGTAERRRWLARLDDDLRCEEEAEPDGCLVAKLGVVKMECLFVGNEGLEFC